MSNIIDNISQFMMRMGIIAASSINFNNWESVSNSNLLNLKSLAMVNPIRMAYSSVARGVVALYFVENPTNQEPSSFLKTPPPLALWQPNQEPSMLSLTNPF